MFETLHVTMMQKKIRGAYSPDRAKFWLLNYARNKDRRKPDYFTIIFWLMTLSPWVTLRIKVPFTSSI